jgi:hypothetical protein
MLMITPALRALMDACPEAELHMLTSIDGQRVFKGFSAQLTIFLLHDRNSLFATLKLKRLLKLVQTTEYGSAYGFELNPSFCPARMSERKAMLKLAQLKEWSPYGLAFLFPNAGVGVGTISEQPVMHDKLMRVRRISRFSNTKPGRFWHRTSCWYPRYLKLRSEEF